MTETRKRRHIWCAHNRTLCDAHSRADAIRRGDLGYSPEICAACAVRILMAADDLSAMAREQTAPIPYAAGVEQLVARGIITAESAEEMLGQSPQKSGRYEWLPEVRFS